MFKALLLANYLGYYLTDDCQKTIDLISLDCLYGLSVLNSVSSFGQSDLIQLQR